MSRFQLYPSSFSLTSCCLACLVNLGSPPALGSERMIYEDGLASDWVDWSWDTKLSTDTVVKKTGASSLSIEYSKGWAGLSFRTAAPVDTSGYTAIRFWARGATGGGKLALYTDAGDEGPSSNVFEFTPTPDSWTSVEAPLSALGNPPLIARLNIMDGTGKAQPAYHLDTLRLVGKDLQLSVDAAAGRKVISPYIYGMNFADETLAAELHLPLRRWGGNATTRYNWRTSLHNLAGDWFFENYPDGEVNIDELPNGSATDQFVEQDRRTGARTLLTMPLIGWTTKTTSPRNHPLDCAFKVSKYGPQQATDPWDPDCGNGIRLDGSPITDNDPADTSEPITPAFVKAWIQHLKSRYGSARKGGVAFYDFDNEPMLWNSTHIDLHRIPASYDEIRDRTYQYGPAIKTADPSAQTLGPVAWGWCEYFYSALDGCSEGEDFRSHGNQAYVPWYLQQMRAYEQSHGRRILNYLDLHYYPQATGVFSDSAGDAATQTLRLRSTRSLWDPGYVDESWIAEAGPDGGVVKLIPRMRAWVNAHYPGTKLAITEYSWGALGTVNGALAQADVLGIFGREGLGLAALWGPPTARQPGAFAFRMYINYDGRGGKFGDVSVRASSNFQGELAIFAAEEKTTGALTLMIINKTSRSLSAPIALKHFTPAGSLQGWRYGAANPSRIVTMAKRTLTGVTFANTFPANSMTLYRIAGKQP